MSSKATVAQKKVVQGKTHRKYSIHTKTHFFRPKTLRLRAKPVYERTPIAKRPMDATNIFRYPVKNDANSQLIESNNTLVFVVDRSANKSAIKAAFTKVFDAKVEKINTLITPLGEKKAFIRIVPSVSALDVASKIGLN